MKIFYNRILPFAFVFSLFSYSVCGETNTAVELWSIDTAGDAIQEEVGENQDDQDVNYEGGNESTTSNELIETQSIQTQEIGANQFSFIGILDRSSGGYGTEVWQEMDDKYISNFFNKLPIVFKSSAMKKIANKLFLTIANPPLVFSSNADVNFSQMKVSWFLETGNVKDLYLLGEGHDIKNIPNNLQEARINYFLLENKIKTACLEVKSLIAKEEKNPYWQKVRIYCQIIEGDNYGAELSLELLRESKPEKSETFFNISNALLGNGEFVEIGDDFDNQNILSMLMLHSINDDFPEDIISEAKNGSISLQILSHLKFSNLEEKLPIVEKAAKLNLIQNEVLEENYRTVSFVDNEIESLITDRQFDESMTSYNARALLFQALRKAFKHEDICWIVKELWHESKEDKLQFSIAPIILDKILVIEVKKEFLLYAQEIIEILLITGQYEKALEWYQLFLKESNDKEISYDFVRLSFLIGLKFPNELGLDNEKIYQWLINLENSESKKENLELLMIFLENHLDNFDQNNWDILPESVNESNSYMPSLSVIKKLRMSSENQAIGNVMTLSLLTVKDKNIGELHPFLIYEIIKAFEKSGLSDDAYQITLESLII